MYLTKVALLLALAFCVQSKYIPAWVSLDDLEEIQLISHEPILRVRRQTGALNTNPDGSQNLNLKVPIAGNDHNQLSALGSVSGFKDGKFGAAGGGLALDNVNGHGLSLTETHVPGFGNQLTAAGRATLLQNEDHRLGANAFITRNMPTIPNVPDFNKYGGGLDYMYNLRTMHPEQIHTLEGNEDNQDYKLLDTPFARNGLFLENIRPRRQTGSLNSNPDGSQNLNLKMPITGNDQNQLSAVGIVSGFKDGKFEAAGGGLALENVYGHSLTLTGEHIPTFGEQLTAAGRAIIFQNNDHTLGANAYITRNMLNIPNHPDFNNYGGSFDYMFKDKVGGSLGISYSDLLQRKDYSALAKLNLFKNQDSSLDLTAGLTKSQSPLMKDTEWQPYAGLTYTKNW